MKKIFYTQRVEVIAAYNERRDATDQNISKFLFHCGYLPVALPNDSKIALNIIKNFQPDGFFFTGGNSLVKYGGDAPERDETEKNILEYAIKNKISVFGICRGMQFLADYFGAELEPIKNHVRTRHKIEGIINRDEVNSYHTFGLFELPECLEILGKTFDGSTEIFRHRNLKIMAVGWHPEREEKFSAEDVEMIKNFFGR